MKAGLKLVAKSKMPELCAEYGLAVSEEGIAVVSSRHVAERFGKRHDHVLRDIEQILAHPNLGALKWFHQTRYVDDQGKERPSYLLTRDAFIVLVMGYTGEWALTIKISYIQAFNLMEETLLGRWRDGMNWSEGVEQICQEIGELKTITLRVADETKQTNKLLRSRRKEITITTKGEHVWAVGKLGGRCPCCGLIEVVKDGERVSGEFDHFFQNSLPGPNTTWLICLGCHDKLTNNQLSRDGPVSSAFHVYQGRRRDLGGRQGKLF